MPLTLEALVDYAANQMVVCKTDLETTFDNEEKARVEGRIEAYEDIMQKWFYEHEVQ
jgi:hypothetical protein